MQTIVIVDDSSMMRKVIRRAVESLDVPTEIVEAANGQEALEKLEKLPHVHLLITDLNMPGMGGEELLTKLFTWPKRPDATVVVSSTLSSLRKLRLTRLGVDCTISKPFQADRLQLQLEPMLQQVMPPKVDDQTCTILDAAVIDTLSHMTFRLSMPMDQPQTIEGPVLVASIQFQAQTTGSMAVVLPAAWCLQTSTELTGDAMPIDFAAEIVNIVGGGVATSIESCTGADVAIGTPSVVEQMEAIDVDRAYMLEDQTVLGVVWNLTLPVPAEV